MRPANPAARAEVVVGVQRVPIAGELDERVDVGRGHDTPFRLDPQALAQVLQIGRHVATSPRARMLVGSFVMASTEVAPASA